MWINLLPLLLLISSTRVLGQSNEIEGSYEKEMNEFMDLLPDPEGPMEIGLRSDFEDKHDDMLADLEADEHKDAKHCEWNSCENLNEPSGIRKLVDWSFVKKVVQNLNPFANKKHRMLFYLFRKEFPDCGKQMHFHNGKITENVGFNSSLPTRIIVHGWMSQSRGSFNRDVKRAYLKRGDYNVIVVDWSASSANVNYFAVVKLIEELGAQLVQFTRQLNRQFGAQFDDMYLIGHSLGAQIAGAAGKRLKPKQYNTIFALDPAGPKFRQRSPEFRIDASDAKYVESMHTSGIFGFLKPTGAATFYPNFGLYQRNCFYLGCSHIRAYQLFAESINSEDGFWGTPCKREHNKWNCDYTQRQSNQMGGEPSIKKQGIFYVKTSGSEPYALGKR